MNTHFPSLSLILEPCPGKCRPRPRIHHLIAFLDLILAIDMALTKYGNDVELLSIYPRVSVIYRKDNLMKSHDLWQQNQSSTLRIVPHSLQHKPSYASYESKLVGVAFAEKAAVKKQHVGIKIWVAS